MNIAVIRSSYVDLALDTCFLKIGNKVITIFLLDIECKISK